MLGINITVSKTKISLILHFDANKSYLYVNKIDVHPICFV